MREEQALVVRVGDGRADDSRVDLVASTWYVPTTVVSHFNSPILGVSRTTIARSPSRSIRPTRRTSGGSGSSSSSSGGPGWAVWTLAALGQRVIHTSIRSPSQTPRREATLGIHT